MGPVVATEGHVEGLELDPVGLGCVPFRLLDLGDEARVHEFLPLRFRTRLRMGRRGSSGVESSIGSPISLGIRGESAYFGRTSRTRTSRASPPRNSTPKRR